LKILVTGAQGFIGQYTVEELLRRGHTPIVFDVRDTGFRPDETEFMLGDIRDEVAVTEAFAHADGFIHLAGVLGTQETIKNPIPAAETNILGGLNILMAAAQYDVPGVNIAVGNYWMNNTYSISKNTIERFVAMFNKESGTRINVVRPTNCFGPRQSSYVPYGSAKVKKITPAFINAAIRDLPIGIYGDGTQVSDMIFVEDVAKVLVTAMEHAYIGKIYEQAFEVGYGEPITVNEVAETVIRLSGSKSVLQHSPMRPGEEEHGVVLADPSTLLPLGISKDDFVSLEDGLNRTINWFRETQRL
jgi:nucleoside-diphosphate-sugar epimerase